MDTADIKTGDDIKAHVARGEFTATVKKVQE